MKYGIIPQYDSSYYRVGEWGCWPVAYLSSMIPEQNLFMLMEINTQANNTIHETLSPFILSGHVFLFHFLTITSRSFFGFQVHGFPLYI